jgi:hypothetical protein
MTVNGIQSPRSDHFHYHPHGKKLKKGKKLEEELDVLSSHSSDPEGPEDPGDPRGKSIEEITAWCK